MRSSTLPEQQASLKNEAKICDFGEITSPGVKLDSSRRQVVPITTNFTLRADQQQAARQIGSTLKDVVDVRYFSEYGFELVFVNRITAEKCALTANSFRHHWAKWLNNHRQARTIPRSAAGALKSGQRSDSRDAIRRRTTPSTAPDVNFSNRSR